MSDRKPPQSLESEVSVIGSLLCDGTAMPQVCEVVNGSDFYAHVHEDIFHAMLEIYNAGERVDKFSVFAELQKHNLTEKVGGISYLSRCMDTVQTTQSTVYHANIVREKSILRGLISRGEKITEIGYQGEVDAHGAVREAEATLRSVTERGLHKPDGENMGEVIKRLMFEMQSDKKPSIKSPWPKINAMTGGFFPGEVVTWAARPKLGKSACVAYLSDYVAEHFGRVLFFALEMGRDETVRRFLSMYSGISTTRQRTSDLKDHDWDRMGDAMEVLNSRPITVYGRPKSVLDIRNAVRRESQKEQVRMVVIDHAGMLDEARNSGAQSSKHERLDDAYVQLSDLAFSEKFSLHIVQHVNRKGYDSPGLSDIRDGGNLEGISHVVIFPNRPNQLGTPEEQKTGEFIVAANRSGAEGIVPMRFENSRHVWLEEGAPLPTFRKNVASVA